MNHHYLQTDAARLRWMTRNMRNLADLLDNAAKPFQDTEQVAVSLQHDSAIKRIEAFAGPTDGGWNIWDRNNQFHTEQYNAASDLHDQQFRIRFEIPEDTGPFGDMPSPE